MLFFHDKLSFKRLINLFVERPNIRRNKSNKAIDPIRESAPKECLVMKSKKEFDECMANFYAEFGNPEADGG